MKIKLTKDRAKNIWINAQRLDSSKPFGSGSKAVVKAIGHLGYVQIDTISVVERCHHHILFNRIPNYKKSDLHKTQSIDKSVFEYWTHALAYIATNDFKYFIHHMKRREKFPSVWFGSVSKAEMNKVLGLLKEGTISIRDIKDDVLNEEKHIWVSRKPSKKALQWGFNCGKFVISEREGMLKKYDLVDRHFNWNKKPKAVSDAEYTNYTIDRALRSQGVVSLDSICHLEPKAKSATLEQILKRVKKSELAELQIEGIEKPQHWIKPEVLENKKIVESELTHILSPFDPLIIQRKKLKSFFDYEHIFEAYVPKEKRKFGYFTLPVLIGNQIVAVLDLKTDREARELLIQSWHWVGPHKSKINKALIESELERFERFQLQ
ncbi:MAG: crosslink repair DNA glycosylase YcaQ family protein [Pseudobdellovibrio sp.]